MLDDYHLIEEPRCTGSWRRSSSGCPDRARLVIATRADPALPLARLRARGELLEVRADELRFTGPKADELVRSTWVELLPDRGLTTLVDRTGGWAAVLQLAAVSLRGRADHAEFVQRFGASHRYVLDYVVEEVLDGLDARHGQEFLLRTSILERLGGPLCDAVTGRNGWAGAARGPRAPNLLGAPLDDERRWYRYHALFAGILRARLAVLAPRARSPGLHARASAWCEQNGDDDEAIRHALQSGDLERAGRIVAEASRPAPQRRRARRPCAGGSTRFPPQVVRDDAQLSASYGGACCSPAITEGVAERLDDAERALAEGRDGGPVMRTRHPAAARAPALAARRPAGRRDDRRSRRRASRADLVPDGLPPVARATLRGTAAALLGLALLRAGRSPRRVETYEQALPDLRAAGNWFAVGRAVGDLAQIAIASGDPARALRLCESELERGGPGSPAAANATIWAALARARLELGQLEPAGGRRATRPRARRSMRGTRPARGPPRPRSPGWDPRPRGDAVNRGGGVRRAAGTLVEPLTPREVEVLRLVALGRTNRQIADELFVTVGTVKSHVHAISAKLGAANRVEAVARGRELGLLD